MHSHCTGNQCTAQTHPGQPFGSKCFFPLLDQFSLERRSLPENRGGARLTEKKPVSGSEIPELLSTN